MAASTGGTNSSNAAAAAKGLPDRQTNTVPSHRAHRVGIPGFMAMPWNSSSAPILRSTVSKRSFCPTETPPVGTTMSALLPRRTNAAVSAAS